MKTKPLKPPAIQEELLACMDYLHGDIVDNEFRAACYYEYARESFVLDEAARLWASRKHSYEESEHIALAIEKAFPSRLCSWWWSLVWPCPSFPRKSWNQLSQRERTNIVQCIGSAQIQPLSVWDVWSLTTKGVIDQLNAMAAKVRESYRLGHLPPKIYPIVEGPTIVDLSNRRKKNEFRGST